MKQLSCQNPNYSVRLSNDNENVLATGSRDSLNNIKIPQNRYLYYSNKSLHSCALRIEILRQYYHVRQIIITFKLVEIYNMEHV